MEYAHFDNLKPKFQAEVAEIDARLLLNIAGEANALSLDFEGRNIVAQKIAKKLNVFQRQPTVKRTGQYTTTSNTLGYIGNMPIP